MSIFNNTALTNNGDEIVACEGYDIALGGNFDAMMESFDDDLAIIEAMHAFDMAELEAIKESGTDVVSTPVMEASLKEIWEKIKTFFANLGKKILAFFNGLIEYLFSITHSGSEFYKKYKPQLDQLSNVNVTYEGYDYTIDMNLDRKPLNKFNGEVDGLVADIKKADINKEESYKDLEAASELIDTEKPKMLDELRKEFSGVSESEKYSNALFKKFRGGADAKKTITITKLSDKVLPTLGRSDDIIKSVKAFNDEIKKHLSKMTGNINEMANEAAKADKESKYTSRAAKRAACMRSCLSLYQQGTNITTMALNAYSSAVKEAVGTYKSVCLKALKAGR